MTSHRLLVASPGVIVWLAAGVGWPHRAPRIYLDAEAGKKAEASNNATLARPWALWLRHVKEKEK
ncbi:MAG TPA: hypothetical protein VKB80_06175 [Kofleriaceae bacterium]|nr:hypothetical protein [Kofleriaceae bacterium]